MAKPRTADRISPMLCTLVKEVPETDNYLFEYKWDGYRIIASVIGGKVQMSSRGGLNYTSRYPLIEKALKDLGHDVILDGEVVVFNEEGKPDFDALQLYNGHGDPIQYCVFDMLSLNGKDITELPLVQRKTLLETVVGGNEDFRFSESFDDGKKLYQEAVEQNLEGIVAKDRSSTYEEGSRGNAWLKIPTKKRQEFVIGGWAESDKSRSFKSLLFGAYENGKFMWIGRSGGGYKHSEMPGILAKLKALEIDESPFENKVLDTKGAKTHYVKPELVANFEFATWTKSGRIRKPATFLGFRDDKKAADVVREVPKDIEVVEEEISEESSVGEGAGSDIGKAPEVQTNASKSKSRKPVPAKPEASGSDEDSDPQLEKYRDKRHFDKTAEPLGGKPGKDELVFVVQKHDASHLHYDFRLEMRGVLKSWAVPKGPSLDPEIRRLAMAVEDHPFDYKDFEGLIPKGQYGGGTVIIWDQGIYTPADKITGKEEQEHWLLSNYYKGSLRIKLNGEKLKGEFLISKNREKGDNAWFLTKVKDKFARKKDITLQDKSVVSGLSIAEMAESENPDVWQSNRKPAANETVKSERDGSELEEAMSDASEESDQYPGIQTVGELYGSPKVSSYSNWAKIFEEKVKSHGKIEIDGREVHLTNIERALWTDIRKADLITYYNSVADLILPYLKNRPLSLHVKNLSPNAPGFYIKDMEGHQPEYVDIFQDKRRIPKKGKRNLIDYSICNNKAALIWLVNLGCIDFNPWSAPADHPTEPDYISIDLDPSDEDFQKVIDTAEAVKEVLDANDLDAVVKTSGKTGLHIFIPCAGFDNATCKRLGKIIFDQVNELVPDITTDTVSKDKREGKVYVDYTLNDYADTLASAYSVRPHHIPTVSTPLQWKEVRTGLNPADFTVGTVLGRFEKKGDLFEDLFDADIKKSNTQILQKLLKDFT